MTYSRVLTTLVFVASLAAAGCGEDRKGSVDVQGGGTDTAGQTGTSTSESGSKSAPGGPVVATVKVKETEYELHPANPGVDRAGVVDFEVRNAGTTTHALEVEGPAGEAKTKGIKPGGTAELKVDLSKAGRYEWYCPIDDHKGRGMKGEITVAGGGGAPKADDSKGKGKPKKDSGSKSYGY